MNLYIAFLAAVISMDPHNFIDDQKFHDWFNKARINERYPYTYQHRDGCNLCTGIVYKVSDTEVRVTDAIRCTSILCEVGVTVKVK